MLTFSTSGTTGKPHRFSLTADQMRARAADLNDTTRGIGFEGLKRIFIDFHPDTYIHARYALYARNHGVTLFTPSTGSIDDAVALFKRENIQGIASTPQGLLNYAQAVDGSHSFAWIFASTARMSANRSKLIRAGLGDNLFSSYATSEVGTIALATGDQIETLDGCVGKVLDGVTVDFDNGEIIVKVVNTTINGYQNEPELTAQKFKNGWFYTGDLGHMQGDLLVYEGRKPS